MGQTVSRWGRGEDSYPVTTSPIGNPPHHRVTEAAGGLAVGIFWAVIVCDCAQTMHAM